MEYTIYTDLAIESAALKDMNRTKTVEGVKCDNYEKEHVSVTKVEIVTDDAAEKIGKPIGNYVTLDVPKLRENVSEAFDSAKEVLTNELKEMLCLKKDQTVLVVGLGNRFVTPDALGPKVVDRLLVTRHLYGVLPDELTKTMTSLCAVSPGVLGITGIETGEIIKGICDKIKPDLVVAIDALASRKTSRISTTFQIADTGIVPGSGIGNKRKGLTKDTLGVPVVAIGVPTVIDAAAVASDAIELLIEAVKTNTKKGSPLYEAVNAFDNDNRYNLICEILSPSAGDLIVTPKEVDSIIDEVSKIIADSINSAVNGEMAEKLGEIL
ncbi:MAG: GPR endopeptidase [Clostridia bacterium]|nr:GPR endopeptidase [Clostridia bacterium]